MATVPDREVRTACLPYFGIVHHLQLTSGCDLRDGQTVTCRSEVPFCAAGTSLSRPKSCIHYQPKITAVQNSSVVSYPLLRWPLRCHLREVHCQKICRSRNCSGKLCCPGTGKWPLPYSLLPAFAGQILQLVIGLP